MSAAEIARVIDEESLVAWDLLDRHDAHVVLHQMQEEVNQQRKENQ